MEQKKEIWVLLSRSLLAVDLSPEEICGTFGTKNIALMKGVKEGY